MNTNYSFNNESINNVVKSGVFRAVLDNVNFSVIDQIERVVLITGDAPYEHVEKVIVSKNDGTLYWLDLERSSASEVFNYIKERYNSKVNPEVFLVRHISVSATGMFVGNYELDLGQGTLKDVDRNNAVNKFGNRLSGLFIPDLVLKH